MAPVELGAEAVGRAGDRPCAAREEKRREEEGAAHLRARLQKKTAYTGSGGGGGGAASGGRAFSGVSKPPKRPADIYVFTLQELGPASNRELWGAVAAQDGAGKDISRAVHQRRGWQAYWRRGFLAL